jgi:hypothetical protein
MLHPSDPRHPRLDVVRTMLHDRATRDTTAPREPAPMPADRRALWQARLAAFTRNRPPARGR